MGKEQKESPANVLVDQGLNQYLQDNFDKAVTLWKSALKLDPKNSRAQQFLDQAETENRTENSREEKATSTNLEAIAPEDLPQQEEDDDDDEFADFVDDLSDHAFTPASPNRNLDFEPPVPTRPIQQAVLEQQLEQLRPSAGFKASSFDADELTPTHLVKRDLPPRSELG